MIVLTVILLLGVASASPIPSSYHPSPPTTSPPHLTTAWTTESSTTELPTCEDILLTTGTLKENYGRAIAHRLHSITSDDIKFYFGEDISEDNGIPTVNEDMSPEAQRVLPNAPSADYDKQLLTQAMKQLDKVLSHMDNKDYAIVNYSILEKITHSFHMSELWARAKFYYDLLTLSPVPAEVCDCLTSPESDVVPALELLALKIKFPGLTSGAPPAAPNILSPSAYEISYGLKSLKGDDGPEYRRHLRSFDFSGDDDDVVTRARQELIDGDSGLDERLDSEEGWQAWKEGFKNMDDYDNYQFAVYMHCSLR